MAAPPRTLSYECPRCGACVDQLGHYKKHLARKTLCKAKVADVIPTLANVKMSKLRSGSSSPAPMTVHVENSPHATVNVDNSVNADNRVTHINNTYHINAFGHEDKSFITPEVLTELIAAHAAENALVKLVMHVHFNPAVPHNMNVFAHKDTPSRARVFDGTGWTEFDKEDTAMRMAHGVADDLVSHIQNNPEKMNVRRKEEYMDYCDEGMNYDGDMLHDTMTTMDTYSYLVKARFSKPAASP